MVGAIFWIIESAYGEAGLFPTIGFAVFASGMSLGICGFVGKQIYDAGSENRLASCVRKWARYACKGLALILAWGVVVASFLGATAAAGEADGEFR